MPDLELDGSLIEPLYIQSQPNQPISLGSHLVEFTYGNGAYKLLAEVVLRFAPDARLMFVIPGEMLDQELRWGFGTRDRWDGKLKLPDRQVTLDMHFAGSGEDYGGLALVPRYSAVTVTAPGASLSAAAFHLFNFPQFYGEQDYSIRRKEPQDAGWKRCGRVVLAGDGWRVTIAATKDTDDRCKALDRCGGFIVTHMGRIEREDGSDFSGDQLDDVLHALHRFLSFATGRWAGVALPIGFDKQGNRAFEQWGLPIVRSGPWNCSLSWFDEHHGELLPQVFRGFMALWRDPVRQRLLVEGLHWYLGANDRGTGIGVEAGLILAQTALELFAWTYCVQHRKMISPKAFEPRSLSAADKLRLLASGLDIPLELPGCFQALNARPGQKWQDAMEAITTVRNAVVHPHETIQLRDSSSYEAMKLSLWYIDMVLLRLCGHNGQYANRLRTNGWVGEVEPVPWAKTVSNN